MPSQTPTPLTTPIPRRRSPLLTNTSFGQQDISLCLTSTLNSKAQSPYTFITRDNENDYSPPAPPGSAPPRRPRRHPLLSSTLIRSSPGHHHAPLHSQKRSARSSGSTYRMHPTPAAFEGPLIIRLGSFPDQQNRAATTTAAMPDSGKLPESGRIW